MRSSHCDRNDDVCASTCLKDVDSVERILSAAVVSSISPSRCRSVSASCSWYSLRRVNTRPSVSGVAVQVFLLAGLEQRSRRDPGLQRQLRPNRFTIRRALANHQRLPPPRPPVPLPPPIRPRPRRTNRPRAPRNLCIGRRIRILGVFIDVCQRLHGLVHFQGVLIVFPLAAAASSCVQHSHWAAGVATRRASARCSARASHPCAAQCRWGQSCTMRRRTWRSPARRRTRQTAKW